MTRKTVQAAVLPETKELVQRIADATNEKKTYIYDMAIIDYAKKKQIEIPSES